MPTSRATRVTSEVKALICSIMALTMLAERRNSPCSGRPSTSRRMVCDRSPLATAAIARVTSVVGQSRSSISVLTEPSIAPQEPERRSSPTRCRVRPSLPTMRPACSSSLRQALVRAHDLVEGIGDFAGEAGLVAGQADGEVAVPHRLQGTQDFTKVESIGFGTGVGTVRLAALGLGTLLWRLHVVLQRDDLATRVVARASQG